VLIFVRVIPNPEAERVGEGAAPLVLQTTMMRSRFLPFGKPRVQNDTLERK